MLAQRRLGAHCPPPVRISFVAVQADIRVPARTESLRVGPDMPLPFYSPRPAPVAALGDHAYPLFSRNPLARLFFTWFTALLRVGYSRPLEQNGQL